MTWSLHHPEPYPDAVPGRRELDAAVADLVPVSLEHLVEVADLRTRVDRKYLVPATLVVELVRAHTNGTSALEIGSRRGFRYESVYFDTPDMLTYRLHARSRPKRFKVRTRTYLDSDSCMFEVKSSSQRGETVKQRLPHPMTARARLTPEGADLVRPHLPIGVAPERLRPSVTTTYTRATLLDVQGSNRLTLDTDLRFRSGAEDTCGAADLVLVETKASGALTPADRWLWRHRVRPISVSKYCLGAALADPSLPASRWNRVLRRHFGWEPAPRRVEPVSMSGTCGTSAGRVGRGDYPVSSG